MLRWTFGVLHAEVALCLSGLSLWNVLFLFCVIWEFVVVVGMGGIGVGDCQNDCIVG